MFYSFSVSMVQRDIILITVQWRLEHITFRIAVGNSTTELSHISSSVYGIHIDSVNTAMKSIGHCGTLFTERVERLSTLRLSWQ